MKVTAICSPLLLVSSLLLPIIIQRDCNNFLGAKKHAINNKLITPSTLSLYICVECFE